MLRQKARKSAVFLAAFVGAVFAQDEESSVEAIKSTCDEAVWLQTVQDHYIKNVQTAAARNSDLLTEARNLTLAAAQFSDQTQQAVLTSLAAIADQRATAAAAILNRETPSLLAAVALLNERRGNVRALSLIMNTQESATFSGSTTTAGDNVLFAATTVKCFLIATLDKKPTAECTVTEQSATKLVDAGHHLAKITKMKAIPLTKFGMPQLGVDIETKGTFTAGSNQANENNKCADKPIKSSETNGAGLTKLALNQPTAAPTDVKMKDNDGFVNVSKEKDHYITTGTQVASATYNLRALTSKLLGKIADETADSLSNDHNVQNVIYLTLGKGENINDSTDQKAEKIKSLFGGAGTKL
ncbi:variant surface glycoprotein (VSG), putative [Trypanosoma equiperdum]|uniref:Variant surface glycoprotein (VSG), putative n=1 Tax=Trypanosoma equiperdum TaxID=5694 RepID=A0A1G4I9S2_TRYEQ|nr:variant surface glycoprotein (VSG), putative [Trypanosoma equiperdum]